jgi:hypothetical protein
MSEKENIEQLDKKESCKKLPHDLHCFAVTLPQYCLIRVHLLACSHSYYYFLTAS